MDAYEKFMRDNELKDAIIGRLRSLLYEVEQVLISVDPDLHDQEEELLEKVRKELYQC